MAKIIDLETEEMHFERVRNILDSVRVDAVPSKQKSLTDFVPKEPKEKITYSQDWASYDKAKTNQDEMFKHLIRDLLFLTINEDKPKTKGRPSYSTEDKIFCMAVKIFYRSDLRKTVSILKELKRLGYIQKVPCFRSIDNFFNDTSLNKILDKLILLSSMPLSQLEDTCAIDSTGFSTCRFERWFNYKWGKHEGKERVWKKAHATLGCKTNVFLSVEVTNKNVADVSMFEKTVGNNLKPFNFERFTADKAYLTRDIMNFLSKLEIIPIIPFKKNSRGTSRGSQIWSLMFRMFTQHNDKFMKFYGRRQNIECGFHMVKQRFGDHLLTKKHEANVNEIKMKFLCHNICVLIQELFESDIEIDFLSCANNLSACAINN